MLLLLLMYLSPLLAVALYWRAQSSMASAVSRTREGGSAAIDVEEPSSWATLRAAVEPRLPASAPLAATVAAALVLAGASAGLSGALALVGGMLLSAFAAALVHAAVLTAASDASASPRRIWGDSVALAQTLAALTAGSVGTLAWFYADPSGVAVLVVFATGAALSAFVLRMASTEGEASGAAELLARLEATTGPVSSMVAALAAFAAAVTVAASAEPDALLPLGGLLAETETLRSELLLLPIAVTVLSPIVAVLVSPFVGPLVERRGEAALFDAERIAAAMTAAFLLALVFVSGLAWAVAWPLLAGIAARQIALVADDASFRGGAGELAQAQASSALPALVAAIAFLCGERLAGFYGIALVALGMSSSFVTVAAIASARRRLALEARPEAAWLGGDDSVAETSTTLAASLALLAALTPALVAESLHSGEALTLVITAAPALFAGTLVGAAAASVLATRPSAVDSEAESLREIARAAGLAVALPVAAGLVFGAPAAAGIVLGAVACSATARVGNGKASFVRGQGRSTLLAWGRVMAMCALVGAPLMR